jgi:hypothetical protein
MDEANHAAGFDGAKLRVDFLFSHFEIFDDVHHAPR